MKRSHSIQISRQRAAGMARECEKVIRTAAVAALDFCGADMKCTVSVTVTGENEIRKINLENRGIDRVTDVLSFPMLELSPGDTLSGTVEDADMEDGRAYLGDMVICWPRTVSQAAEYGHSNERELAFLTVHSILHLLGYDHELGETEEKLMFGKTEEILEGIGLTR